MPSDRCEELLATLVSGDLGEEQERAARAEIAGCSAHAASLRKLDVGMRFAALLPSVEPRAGLDDAILAAARAKVAAPKAAAAAPKPAPAAEESFAAKALAVLRRMATGQQLAMSTVMLLVVAIGLWYLPARRDMPNAAGETVMAPQLADEPPRSAAPYAPSAAAPARSDADRVASAPAQAPSGPKPEPSRGGLPAAQRAQRSEPAGLAATTMSARRADGEGMADPGAREALEEQQAPLDALATRQSAPSSARPAEEHGYVAQAERTEAAPARSRATSGASGGAVMAPPASPMAAPTPAPAATPRAADDATGDGHVVGRAPAAEAEAAPEGSAYDRAMALYASRRFAEAAELFRAAVQAGGPQAASALHHLGRSHRASGQCAIAVQEYERLLGGFPAYGQRTQAMIEAADCYQRTGHLAAAERWLERAAASAPASVAARRELGRVRALRQAEDAVETPRAAPPASDNAAAESY